MKDFSNENIVHQKCGEIEYIQFRRLLAYPEVEHCFTLKHGLNFKRYGEENHPLQESYEKIANVFHWDKDAFVKPHQTHTDRVEIVQRKGQEFSEVDGLMTNQENIILCTTEADCTGLLFYDPVHHVIANVHSGWRGTLQRIGQKAVKKMEKTYQSQPKDIICCIGPHIRKCHFEVEEDVKQLFEEEFFSKEKDSICYPKDQIIVKGTNLLREGKEVQKYFIDTTTLNILLLQEMGLCTENIIDSGICTVCEAESFHSYRVAKELSGRNGSFIMVCNKC